MTLQDIRKIYLFGRGSNRDESGNPYYAFRAIVCLKHNKEHIELSMSMDWGSSDKDDVFVAFRERFLAHFGVSLGWEDLRNGLISYEYKHVSVGRAEAEMEHPELWKVELK